MFPYFKSKSLEEEKRKPHFVSNSQPYESDKACILKGRGCYRTDGPAILLLLQSLYVTLLGWKSLKNSHWMCLLF